jgi:RNA polymerase sigma-70 factor, ECF subfamily
MVGQHRRTVVTDRALVEQAIAGDTDAYATLARATARRLFLVAHRILRDTDAAEDAVQQTLVTIWTELPRLRDPSSFESWSYRIVTRAALAEAKRQVRHRSIIDIGATEPTTPDQSAGVETRDAVEQAFRRLTPEARAVVVLRFYADLPIKDIGFALGIPAGTVASRLHRAMRDMRSTLSREEPLIASVKATDDGRVLAGEPTR